LYQTEDHLMDDAGMTVNLSNFSDDVWGFYRTIQSYKIDLLPRSARPFKCYTQQSNLTPDSQ